jgi:hypothetical protein
MSAAAFLRRVGEQIDELAQADDDELVADYARTRIEPGADPRVRWTGYVTIGARGLERALFEFTSADGLPALWSAHGLLERGARPAVAGDQHRYVPVDVARWRDPEHWVALKHRARELAIATPRLRGER